MNWYAAHLVLYVQFQEGKQTHYPVWENIVLLCAEEDLAMARAEQLGREQEGDDSGTFTWGGRSATWVFAGVRKLMTCATAGTELQNGVEITFNEMVFASLDDVQSFVEDEPVQAGFGCAPVEEVPTSCASGA